MREITLLASVTVQSMPYEPADYPTSKCWARVALLEAVKELKPKLLSELKDLLDFFQLLYLIFKSVTGNGLTCGFGISLRIYAT